MLLRIVMVIGSLFEVWIDLFNILSFKGFCCGWYGLLCVIGLCVFVWGGLMVELLFMI